jgi:hypothetical protein
LLTVFCGWKAIPLLLAVNESDCSEINLNRVFLGFLWTWPIVVLGAFLCGIHFAGGVK